MMNVLDTQREQYDKTPKIPLIIGLCALLLVIMTIIWLVVYRKIRRRQRRRTIGVRLLYIHSNANCNYLLYKRILFRLHSS